MAEGCDITLPYLARHCDVFYIGGTKIGALCGEAVVFTHGNAHKHFFSIQKQHGAVIAKGALIGLQFEALFTDNLYFKLARHAIEKAMQMKQLFQEHGYEFYLDSPTNQQFVILPNEEVERLEKQIQFTHWGPYDEKSTICRFVTSWATTDEDLKTLRDCL
jgi:threonine aldolase